MSLPCCMEAQIWTAVHGALECCHSAVICWEAAPGCWRQDAAGSFESSQLRPHGLAWLEPSWCDTRASQASVCSAQLWWACYDGLCPRTCVYTVYANVCTWALCMLLCTLLNKCTCLRVCVLLPSAPSNRLIFHISHGQEGQEAARLRPESGYSTVSSARHSLAPPKLSALYQTLELANMHWLPAPCSRHPSKGLHYALAPLAHSWGLHSWLGPFQLCYTLA